MPVGREERVGDGATKTHLGIRLRRYDAVIGVARENTPESLKATRAASGGWDLTWAANLLDRSPAEAAAALAGRGCGSALRPPPVERAASVAWWTPRSA